MSTTDGGNIWQMEILNDFLPNLAFYSIDILENKKGWVCGLNDQLLVKGNFISNTMELQSKNIRIYPNPVNTELNIHFEEKINTIILLNHLRKIVYSNESFNRRNIQINMAQLPSGIYFLKINQKVKKIVKL